MSRFEPPGPSLPPGHRLGRYAIDALLGVGGMGSVYRAQDTTLMRPVAVKVLRRDPSAGDVAGWLLREARSASALNHPNICTVYEVGEQNGLSFIAMEYVDGATLAARLSKEPLAVSEVVQHGIEIAGALEHAHERGVVHRDLKAANVIVSSNGRLKIVDFGLARRMDAQSADASTLASIAGAGSTIGTPYAMSPEQVRGEAVDHRTDLWALGVLLYECLSGRQPFAGATLAELFASILRDPPAQLPYTRASGSLQEIIETCLAKDPTSRYQGADEIRLALLELEAPASRAPRATAVGSVETGSRFRPGVLPRPPVLERPAGEPAFVGREIERKQLSAAWERTSAGRRQLVLLAGEPGIGKTRLSLEFARGCADAGATVLVGRCDAEALVPYQPFVEALGWYARACSDTDLRAALAAAGGGGELGPFVPDFLARVPDLPSPTPMNAAGQRYRLFETINALLAAISRGASLLLLLDDLHWADKPTLSLLRHIVRGTDPAALCVLCTYRESELAAGHPLAELLADLRREQGVTRVSLAGLDRQHVGALVETLTTTTSAAPALIEQLADSTGGNPFFVGEMLRHLSETGELTRLREGARSGARPVSLGLPEGVREVILQRTARLSEACSRTLPLASVLGREFDLDLLEALGDLSEDALLDALDDARQAQLVDEVPGRPGRYSFHHALIRDALYDGLTATRRLRLHRRAGEALERLSHGRAEPPLADLAHHFVQAASTGVADKAADYATKAGDRMADALAHEEAARFYDLALHALDALPGSPNVERQRVALQRRRGRAFGNLAQWAQQRAALERALQLLEPRLEVERAEILSDLCQACFWLFDIPSLERYSTAALSLAERLGRDDLAASSMSWLARCRQAGGHLLEVIEMDRVTIERFGALARIAHNFRAAALYWAGRGTEGVEVGARAAEMAVDSRDATYTMNALSHYAVNLASIGRYREAWQVFDEAREFGRRYGVLPLLARAHSMSAGIHLGLGDLDGAEAIQHEARELARSVNFPPTIVSPGIDLLLIAARRQDPGSVESLFEETVAASQRTPGWHGWLWALRLSEVRAELALARHEWEAADQAATETIDLCRRYTRPKYEALALMTRARARYRRGRTLDAIVDARGAAGVARRTEDPALVLQALDLLLDLDGSDAAASEMRDVHARVLDALPEGSLRERFLEGGASARVRRL